MTGGKNMFCKEGNSFFLIQNYIFTNKPLGSWMMLKLIVEYGEFYIKSTHKYKNPRFVQKEGEKFQNFTF